MEHSKSVKTTFIFIFLLTLASDAYSSWDTNSRFNLRNLTALDSSLDSLNTRRVLMNMETQLNASQYKALKGFNQSSAFNAPVPATTTGTLVRTIPISKNSIGSVAKKLALGGARFGAIGVAMEASVLAAGWLYEEYTEQERLNDPSIIEGDYKEIYKTTQIVYDGSGWISSHQSASLDPDLIDGYISYCTNSFVQNVSNLPCSFLSSDPNYPDAGLEVIGFDSTPSTEETTVYLNPDQAYDDFVDSMTDEEFDEFLNDENLKPHVFDIPEIDVISDDTSNDLDTSTDFNPDGTPNQNTNPYTNDDNDDNLDSLSVPDYDASELNNPDPQTNPDPNTDPNENPNNNFSPDPDSGNDPEPNYTLNYQGGHEWAVPDFYTQKYPEGLQKAWTDNEQNFDQTAIVTFLNSFVDGIPTTGTCPSWVVTFNLGVLGNYGSHDIAPDCNVFTIIKIILLVSTAFLMRSIIFGG